MLRRIIGAVKGSVEGKIGGLILGNINGAPLEIYLCWNDDIRDCKNPGKILGSSRKSNEDGILVLALGNVDGESLGTSLLHMFKNGNSVMESILSL